MLGVGDALVSVFHHLRVNTARRIGPLLQSHAVNLILFAGISGWQEAWSESMVPVKPKDRRGNHRLRPFGDVVGPHPEVTGLDGRIPSTFIRVSLCLFPSSTLLMALMTGFEICLRGRTFLTAGGILCAERQSDTPGVPLEHGCAGCSVDTLARRSRNLEVGDLKLPE